MQEDERATELGLVPDPQRAAAWWHDPLCQRQREGKHAAGETLQGAGEDQLGEGRRASGEEESERDDREDEEQDAPRRVIVAEAADDRCGDRRDDERRGEHPRGVRGRRAVELGGGGERGCRHRQREGRADRGEHETRDGADGPLALALVELELLVSYPEDQAAGRAPLIRMGADRPRPPARFRVGQHFARSTASVI